MAVIEEPPARQRPASAEKMVAGTKVYEEHCAACHADRGQGVSGMYPALAGNRAVTLASHINLVQQIRRGGFLPTTAGKPSAFRDR